MRILAIESSGPVAGAALWEDGVILGSASLAHRKTHSQTLLPLTRQLLHMLDRGPQDIDAVAVSKGPGSFTGLKIGAASAKGLALALDCPVIGVPTLDAMAYGLWGASGLICPILDARRGQVYTALYQFLCEENLPADCGGIRPAGWLGEDGREMPELPSDDSGSCFGDRDKSGRTDGGIGDCLEERSGMKTILSSRVCLIGELLDVIEELGQPVLFLGDGVTVYREEIEARCQTPFRFAPPHRALQDPSALAALAACRYEAGLAESADAFRPDYLRLSQAERERRLLMRISVWNETDAKDAGKMERLSRELAKLSASAFGPEGWNEGGFSAALKAPYTLALFAEADSPDAAELSGDSGIQTVSGRKKDPGSADDHEKKREDRAVSGLCGFAFLSLSGDEAELLMIAVAPDCRRRGVGEQLLSAALCEARVRGVCTVFLEVREGNAAARALYERLRFAPAGRRTRFYQEPEEDALIYRLSLSGTPL